MCNRGREAGAGLAVFILGALIGAYMHPPKGKPPAKN